MNPHSKSSSLFKENTLSLYNLHYCHLHWIWLWFLHGLGVRELNGYCVRWQGWECGQEDPAQSFILSSASEKHEHSMRLNKRQTSDRKQRKFLGLSWASRADESRRSWGTHFKHFWDPRDCPYMAKSSHKRCILSKLLSLTAVGTTDEKAQNTLKVRGMQEG